MSTNAGNGNKHEILRDALRKTLLNGEFKPGERFPSQNELAQEYGISHITAREAVSSLVHEGLLCRIQGKGTFVLERNVDNRTIGIVAPHLLEPADFRNGVRYNAPALMVGHVEREARAVGAHLLIGLDHGEAGKERESLESMLKRCVDGIIVVYIGGDKNLDCLKRIVDSGVPLVMIDHFLEGVPSHYVVTDGYVGAYNATRRLLNTGNEKIYCFTMQECNTQTSDRFAGYSEAIKRHGAAVDNDLIISAKGEDAITLEENGYRLTKKILKNFSGPFSAFAINSPLVSGVWRALEESGLSHDRISLACFDNPMVPIPEDVLLIQVTQPTAEIARRSVQIIAEHIAGNPDPQRIVLPPTVEVASGVNAARLLLPYGEAVSTPVEG